MQIRGRDRLAPWSIGQNAQEPRGTNDLVLSKKRDSVELLRSGGKVNPSKPSRGGQRKGTLSLGSREGIESRRRDGTRARGGV